MTTVSPRPPPAKPVDGPFSRSELATLRGHVQAAVRALDDLHLVVEDAFAKEPEMPPKTHALDMLRHGGEAARQLGSARTIAGSRTGAAFDVLQAALHLAASNLASMRTELELPAVALRDDVRLLETQTRQHLEAAGGQLDRFERVAEALAGVPVSHGCTVLPGMPVGCPRGA